MHFIFSNLSLSGQFWNLLSSIRHTFPSSHPQRRTLLVCLCLPRNLGSTFDSDLHQDLISHQHLNTTLVLAECLKTFYIFIIQVLLIFCLEDKSMLFFVLCLFLINPLLNVPTQSSLICSFWPYHSSLWISPVIKYHVPSTISYSALKTRGQLFPSAIADDYLYYSLAFEASTLSAFFHYSPVLACKTVLLLSFNSSVLD